ncbi:MAG: mechanosensitive ion channel [Pseudomonadales bacterium]
MDLAPVLAPLTAWGLPVLAVLVVAAAVIWSLRRALPDASATRIARQLATVAVVLVANVVLVLLLPFDSETRGQLLSLFGIVLTAIIALSSTTFVSNAMAGLMLRAVGSFHPGDFISVEQHFGRVTELGLLHTEIQSEDRDLITLPALYLITHPVRVVRSSGTLISVEVSLGYDVPRRRVRELLKQAAEQAELVEPFVQIKALQDHAVLYRVSGFLEDVASLVSKRTELHAAVLDALHGSGVEIVSPSFMNQRQLPPQQRVLPERILTSAQAELEERTGAPERMMFDKAELAARLNALEEQRDALQAEIKALQDGGAEGHEIGWREHQVQTLERIIATLRSE